MTSRGWLRKQATDTIRPLEAKIAYALNAYKYQLELCCKRAEHHHREAKEPTLIRFAHPDGEVCVMKREPEAEEKFLKYIRKANRLQEEINITATKLNLVLLSLTNRFLQILLYRCNNSLATLYILFDRNILQSKVGGGFPIQPSPTTLCPAVQTTCAPNV